MHRGYRWTQRRVAHCAQESLCTAHSLASFDVDGWWQFAEDQYNLDATPAHISQLNRAIASGVEGGVFVLPKVPHTVYIDASFLLLDLARAPLAASNLPPKPRATRLKRYALIYSPLVSISSYTCCSQNAKPASKTTAGKAKTAPAKLAGKPKAAATKPAAAKAKKVRSRCFFVFAF